MKKVFTVREHVTENSIVKFAWQKTHGNYLAIYGSSSRVAVYDRHGEFVMKLDLEGKCVGIDWEQQGDVLAVIDSKFNGVYLWEVHFNNIKKVETGFKDNLTMLVWSKVGSQLAVGTSKGNLLLYNHVTCRKVPILGKHSRRITCGAWSEEGLLALSSEDKTFTVSNGEGETIRQVPLRDLPMNIQFSEIKDDERSTFKENTISCTIAEKTLYLFKLTDAENPTELAFQEKYGDIVHYKWYGDGYIMIGFSNGYFVVISTHKKEIGQEIHQSQDYKDHLSNIGISVCLSRAVTVGDRCVKIHDLNNLKELTAIIELDEEEAKFCSWSEDGQLLAVSSVTGNVHVFLTRLPLLACVSSDGMKLAHLTSLREVSICSIEENFKSKSLQIEIEPKFIGIGPKHFAVGMNNQVWFYREDSDAYHLVSEQEYIKTVNKLQLNDDYSAAWYDGKLMLQLIEYTGENDGKEGRSRKTFPDQAHSSEYITSFELTSTFLIFATDKGSLNVFFTEDWCYATEFKHHCGIAKLFVNEVGNAIVFIDTKSNAYLYSPLNDQLLEISDFPNGTNKVLWDYKNDDNTLILACTEDKLCTYILRPFYVDTKSQGVDTGNDNNRPKFEIPKTFPDSSAPLDNVVTKIKFIGFTKTPFGHVPLFLKCGDIVLLNQNGKLITNTLGTHGFKQILKKTSALDNQDLLQYFHQAVTVNYFAEAWVIAEQLNSEEKWRELAEESLKCLNIDFALRIYRRLSDVGMVFSLLKIKFIEDKNLVGGYIAMFLNDFNLAQDLFLNSSCPTAALNMRRDLLHWDSALQLAKAFAPSQIPFISREYAGQLEFIGDYVNAMLNYERGLNNNDGDDLGNNKDLSDHISACMAGIARMSIRLGDAKRGIMMAEQSNNRILMRECAIILEQTKQPTEAAILFEKAQYFDKAISVYIKLKHWNKVGELLKSTTSPKLHLQYAKAREAEGNYKEAAKAYENSKDFDSVIRINLEYLNNPEEAVRIVKATNSKEGAHLVAQYFIKLGDFPSAVQFLVMSNCLNEAFRLAQDNNQMETYAKIIGPDATMEDYLNIANYFDFQKHHHLAGKFYLLASQYEKAIKHLLKVPYVENSPSVDLAIEAIGRANDDKLTHYLVNYLMGEYDNIPKNMKYLFKMYMSLKQYREAGRTAILIAKEEQNSGNYRVAHDLLFSMMQELKQHSIKIPTEMSNNLMLIHSYTIAKLHIKRGDHVKGARMLIRVAESISKFPSHVVPILTSTVIECHRSGLRESSFSYAAMLLRPEYRDQIDPKYRKKMETIIRKPDRTQTDEPKTQCPFCSNMILESMLYCHECKNTLPYCIITGNHIIKEDLVVCPKCEFPAIGSELRSLLTEEGSVCPMCSEEVAAEQLKPIIDIGQYLQMSTESMEQ